MTDIKTENGDIVLDSCGNTVRLSGDDELFQRAKTCIAAQKGHFIYDRQLGSELSKVLKDENITAQRAELVINEALAKFDNAFASVQECGDKVKFMLTINGKTCLAEV